MSGSANWRRQRWAVEIGWRAWTNLLQICRRWSAHRWTHEGGGIRQICRFRMVGTKGPWRCQLAWFRRWWSAGSPVATARPRDANLHFCACCRKSADGRISCVSDSGRAWFRRSSAANGALGSTRHANLHIGDCCRRAAAWVGARNCASLCRWPAGKYANWRNGGILDQ